MRHPDDENIHFRAHPLLSFFLDETKIITIQTVATLEQIIAIRLSVNGRGPIIAARITLKVAIADTIAQTEMVLLCLLIRPMPFALEIVA